MLRIQIVFKDDLGDNANTAQSLLCYNTFLNYLNEGESGGKSLGLLRGTIDHYRITS